MIRFFCSCGTEIFFENSHCSVCKCVLGFSPQHLELLPLQAVDGVAWISKKLDQRMNLCSLRQTIGCNWLIPEMDGHAQCMSCRLTRMIPNLANQTNQRRWKLLEQTKRRALYRIVLLGLPIVESADGILNTQPLPPYPLVFDFIEDRYSNPEVEAEFVASGHLNGVVTINAAEADESYLLTNRQLMKEAYRTLLGHFRHELGHYYGMLLTYSESLNEFRALFGDERQDYAVAMEKYYENGAQTSWWETYISAYASAHPFEDWAETWAHYLHIQETLETAVAYEIISINIKSGDFITLLSEWNKLSVILNALNRSMGVDDAYPFVITQTTQRKLHFIDRFVQFWGSPHYCA